MSLYEESDVTLSLPALQFLDEFRDGRPVFESEKTVRVLVTQYGVSWLPNALLVCDTVDGSMCENPPHILAQVLIPEDPVHLEFFGQKLTMRVSWPDKLIFRIRFEDAEDFWEMTRVLSEALANRAAVKAQRARLIREALASVPMVPSP